jgi:hypothetical protein
LWIDCSDASWTIGAHHERVNVAARNAAPPCAVALGVPVWDT